MSFKKRCLILMSLAIAAFALMPNIYFIADKLGIKLAADWYQDFVNWVASGGTIAGFFWGMFGVAVPGWLLAVASAFGIVSA